MGFWTRQKFERELKKRPAGQPSLIALPDGTDPKNGKPVDDERIENGLALAQEIRRSSSVGIIFVTQKDSEVDRVVGLESAGDDYVTKPVKLRELLALATHGSV